MTPALEPRPELRGPIRRFDAVLGGPIWWAVHLGGTYFLVPRACAWGVEWPLHVLTVAMVLLCARAGLSAVQVGRTGRAAGDHDAARRDVYLGWVGLALAVFFGAVVLAEGTPAFFQSPCV